MSVAPLSYSPYQMQGDINFQNMGQQLLQNIQGAQKRALLQSVAEGGGKPEDLIRAGLSTGDIGFANLGANILQRQQEQQRQAAQDARQRERDKIGDARADKELAQNAAFRNRSLQLQEEAAKDKATIQKLKDDSGNEYLVRVKPDGSFTRIGGGDVGASSDPTNPFAYGGQKEAESKDSGYANRMFRAEGILRSPDSINAATSRWQRTIDQAPVVGSSGMTGLGNSLQSKEYQKYDQAARDFINATLRRESGAAISESEFENAYRQYLPRPGDSPDVLREKQRNRQETISSIAGGGGKNYRPPFTFDPEGNMVRIDPKRNVPTTATNTPQKPGTNRTSTGINWSVEP